MNNKKQTLDAYNYSAKQMTIKFNKMGARIGDIEKTFSYVKKENPHVIELGCGSGRDAVEILKRTDKYLGIDYSEKFIEICKKDVSKNHFKVADLEKLKYPSGIDIIFAFASLLHSDKETMKEILLKSYNSLNKKGVFFISLKYDQYRKYIQESEFGTRTFYYYTPKLIKEISPEGFEAVCEDTQEFNNQQWFSIILRKI